MVLQDIRVTLIDEDMFETLAEEGFGMAHEILIQRVVQSDKKA